MRRIYRKPPLVEAVGEFIFEPGQPWDWTVPGLIYACIKEQFPQKRQQNVVQLTLPMEVPVVQPQISGGIARMQFVRQDNTALVQVGPDLLAINQFRPYPHWEEFKALILEQLDVYQEVVSPRGIKRLGLRYVNKIEVPELRVEVTDYLRVGPQVPKEMPQEFIGFAMRMDVRDEPWVLILQLGTLTPERPNSVLFALDIDYVFQPPTAVPLEKAPDLLEQAHERVEVAFEECITDKARALFEEVK